MRKRYCVSVRDVVIWLFLLFSSTSAIAHGIEDFVELAPGEEHAWTDVTRALRPGNDVLVSYELYDTSQHGIQVSLMEEGGSSSVIDWYRIRTVWVPPGTPAGSVVFDDLPCNVAGNCGDYTPVKLLIQCLGGEKEWNNKRNDCSASASMFKVDKPKVEELSCMIGQLGYGAPCRLTLEDHDERVDTTIKWYQGGHYLDHVDGETFVIVNCTHNPVEVEVANVAGSATQTTRVGCKF